MELRFNNEAEASRLHAVIADLCRARVGQVIEDCLQRHNISGTTVSIKELNIDLGVIHYHEIEKELPIRLHEHLEKELCRILLNPAENNITITTSQLTTLDSVKYFLQYGYLPWNVSSRDAQHLIDVCCTSYPDDLAVIIRKAGQSSIVRYRIAQRFNHEAIINTIRVLEPLHANLIIDFHRHLIVVHTHTSLVKSPKNVVIRSHLLVGDLLDGTPLAIDSQRSSCFISCSSFTVGQAPSARIVGIDRL
jgi:hypothetical protein